VALPESADEQLEEAEDLACLTSLPADAVNYRIHNSFIPTARIQPADSLSEWQMRRERLIAELKEQVVRWFPAEPVAFQSRAGTSDGGWAKRYGQYRDALFQSEPGVWIRAQLIQPREQAERAPLVIYAKRPGDSIYFLDLDELLPLLGRYNVLILNPRWSEHPVSAAEYAEIERTATWCGRSIAAMQLWDILRATQWAHEVAKLQPSSVTLYGKGDMGVLAIYAGVLDDRVDRVILNEPPTSHWRGPALLNVLRITDMPEVAAMLAPRRLVFIRQVPDALELAREVYQLHGAAEQLTQAGSLPEALHAWER
jgi:hypothetical protein